MVFNHLPKLPREAQQAAEKFIAQTAQNIVTDIKADMTAPKRGRTYRRGRIARKRTKAHAGLRGYTTAKGTEMAIVGYKFHRASAPGEAPARDMGALSNSIRAKRSGKLQYMVFTNSDYAQALEFGTRKMAPRPFFRVAVRRRRAEFYQRMRAILDWYGKK